MFRLSPPPARPPRGWTPRIPKDALIETKTVKLRDGTTKTCTIHARDGALGLLELDDRGTPIFVPLNRGAIKAKRKDDGSYRWYGEYDLPVAFGGGGTLTVRLDLTEDDQKRNFNRTEVLSPIPADDADFKRNAWLRNDAESNNNALEDTLFNKRAHSVGRLSQRANLLGYALLVNSLTLYLARRRGGVRGGPPPPERKIAA